MFLGQTKDRGVKSSSQVKALCRLLHTDGPEGVQGLAWEDGVN